MIAQIVSELAWALGWESLKDATRRESEAHPVLAAIGHFLMGVCAGLLSLWVVSKRLTPNAPIPGLSLLLSPLATGFTMHLIGEYWRERGWDRPTMFTFRAGAIFAFGMSLVRFISFELWP